MASVKDLGGHKYGRLTVVAPESIRRFGGAVWRCVCECGNTIAVRSGKLRDGSTESCGCRRAMDLKGEVFGRLTVVSRQGSDARGGALWLCRCGCGSEIIARTGSLTSGNTKSCGECFEVDLTGRSFGRLSVLGWVRGGSGRSSWNCLCECGSKCIVRADRLISGAATSCGGLECSRRYRDLHGQVFGLLMAVAREPERDSRYLLRWVCDCACGNRVSVTANALLCGRKISCGCARDRRLGLMPKEARAKAAASGHRRRALKRGAGGSFTAAQIEDLYERQKGRCAEPSCRAKLKSRFHRDHITPLALGGTNYIRNIQLLCEACNCRKNAKDPLVWARENGRLL